MGRQQQFQVLKGVVRQTLLRRFHTPPISSHPHRERPSPAAAGAGAEWEKGIRRLSDIFSNSGTAFHRASLNPKDFLLDSSSRSVIDRYLCTSLEHNAPSKIDGFISPDQLPHQPAPLFSGVVPFLHAPHHCPARNSLTDNYLASSLTCWPSGLRQSRMLAGRISFLLSRSAAETAGGGGSRGFTSSESSSNSVENGDEVVSNEGRGVGREGQGGDEGVSASVSGRERETVVVKKRRKRKSLIREVQPDSSSSSSAAVASSRRALSDLSEEGKTLAEDSPSASDDNVVLKPRTRKRSKETAEEKILRAFNETPEVLPDGGLDSQTSKLTKPLSSSETVETKPFEIPSFSKAPELGEGRSSVSTSANETIQRALPSEHDSKDSIHIGGGHAKATAARNSPLGVGMAPKMKPASPRSPVISGQVEEVLRKDTLNSDVVAVPAVSTAVSTNQITSAESNSNSNRTIDGSALVEEANLAVSSSHQGEDGVDGAEFSNPRALYRTLVESKGGRPYQNQDKARLNSIFYRFAVSGWVSDQALSLYINSKFFPSTASRFRKFFMHKSSQELRAYVAAMGATNEALQFLFPIFAEFCIHEFPTEISRYRELVNTADMTKPDAWYPFARAIKRKVVYHKGPTNSGKTYNALKRFMEASSGIYCSPLRLLAMEVFDTVNMQGVYCNLHTGQEKKDVPFANHLACTVEMCYLTRQWEVAVIDEMQMMSDEYRGWAWTRAFLGLQADEIHLCGDPSALPLIRNLCSGTGDELVEYEYERFMPLKVAEESLRGDFRNIEAGDCIVAFSRRDIFDIKREVELASKHRCCVVYGALPPETRTQQAKLFNELDNGYNVLVASDAIGMGLNLNIRRVVFFSLDKFDGDSKKPVPPAQVKQIAGRAGRRGSLYPEGVTTTFFSQDLPYLGASMQQAFEPAAASGLFPVYEQVELFASQLPNENFAKLLERFSETCKLDGAFFLCRYDNLKRVANMLEKVKGLSLEDRFNFCFAPVNVRDPQSMSALYRYATAFSQKIPVHVEMGVPSSSARDEFELLDLEARHQVLSMYLWLSQHFPGDLFPQKEQAGEMASQIAVLLGQSLVQSSRRWSKRKLNQPQHRGRPFVNMGWSDNRQRDSWRADKPKSAENLVNA
ncbi:unnamed protein product [Calypogeia fissa]